MLLAQPPWKYLLLVEEFHRGLSGCFPVYSRVELDPDDNGSNNSIEPLRLGKVLDDKTISFGDLGPGTDLMFVRHPHPCDALYTVKLEARFLADLRLASEPCDAVIMLNTFDYLNWRLMDLDWPWIPANIGPEFVRWTDSAAHESSSQVEDWLQSATQRVWRHRNYLRSAREHPQNSLGWSFSI